MRQIIFSFFFIAALLALSTIMPGAAEIPMVNKNVTSIDNLSAKNETRNETLMEQTNLIVMKQAYADYLEGNTTAVVNAFAQDAEYISPSGSRVPLSGVYRGRDQIKGFLWNLSTVAQFTRFEIQGYIVEGNKVVSYGLEQGISKLSGNTFSSDWAAIATFNNGKISRYQLYHDTASIAAANPQYGTSTNQTFTNQTLL